MESSSRSPPLARGAAGPGATFGAVTSRPNLKDFSPERLREQLAIAGLRPFRADQIAAWLYRRGVEDFALMTDLPLEERRRIGAEFELRALEVAAIDRSRDGTVKAALRARDGSVVESVLIPEEDRTTLTDAGVAAVYTPKDYELSLIMGEVLDLIETGRSE